MNAQVLLQLPLTSEQDVVLLQQKARDAAQLLQFTTSSQLKFSVAVAEVCRYVLLKGSVGEMALIISRENENCWLEASLTAQPAPAPVIRPHSPPTGNPDLTFANRLVDECLYTTGSGQDSRILLRQRLSQPVELLEKEVKYLQQELSRNSPVSNVQNLKKQNERLLDLLEDQQNLNQQSRDLIRIANDVNQGNQQLIADQQVNNLLLEKINSELEDFAHTVSHDLKAPLRNIEGLANLISYALETNDLKEANASLDMLRQQTVWMDRLINGILAYAQAGRYQLERFRVDTKELVREVVKSLKVPRNIKVHIDDNLPVLLTEPIYLQQVFSNLIGNALKYHDSPEGNVWVSARQENGELVFQITDDGPGIMATDQENLFTIFHVFQHKSVQNSTGVGLAIVRKIVKDKGGRVWVESVGRGARFHFTWPVNEILPTGNPVE